jgi:hypothetical protein
MIGGRVTRARKSLVQRARPARKSRFHSVRTLRPAAADDRQVTSPNGWSKVHPKTMAERRALPYRCFLMPSYRKYPVCESGKAQYKCKGALAAFRRAELVLRNPNVKSERSKFLAKLAKRRARKLGRRQRCVWAMSRFPRSRTRPKITAGKRGRRVAKPRTRRARRLARA